MKKNHVFHILLICFCTAWVGCEKADLQRSSGDGPRITARMSACDECPDGDCCCGAQLLTTGLVHLTLCGTTSPDNGTTVCSGSSGSCSFSGFELQLTLSTQNEKKLFCMGKGTAFRISSDAYGTVRVSCQNDQTGAQYQDLNFPMGGGTFYYSVDSGCYVLGCH